MLSCCFSRPPPLAAIFPRTSAMTTAWAGSTWRLAVMWPSVPGAIEKTSGYTAMNFWSLAGTPAMASRTLASRPISETVAVPPAIASASARACTNASFRSSSGISSRLRFRVLTMLPPGGSCWIIRTIWIWFLPSLGFCIMPSSKYSGISRRNLATLLTIFLRRAITCSFEQMLFSMSSPPFCSSSCTMKRSSDSLRCATSASLISDARGVSTAGIPGTARAGTDLALAGAAMAGAAGARPCRAAFRRW
mmetsp:Transcript_40387/g.91170  ORF Transcript_40387/g.91170 Transcript_40387/m.91170 type:complete len:249 (+) Transcript_40387:318-1064(+)